MGQPNLTRDAIFSLFAIGHRERFTVFSYPQARLTALPGCSQSAGSDDHRRQITNIYYPLGPRILVAIRSDSQG